MAYCIATNDEQETRMFAEKVAKHLQSNDVLLLEGDLGAGKTTFTKGIAAGLGVKRTVNSPTFTIIKEYQGRLPLYHMDVYRIQDAFEDLGFDEYFTGGGIVVIEWAHLIREQLPEEHLLINIARDDHEKRSITLHPVGHRYTALCEEIFA